ncbi:MAG: hypothetical protein IJ770_03760 [Alphaproteobacteria bacterium]|nr:hypothetical protein [Alphaproteobacteria bacterium]
MEYKTEFETRKDVKKMFVANGIALYFVPDGTGKYEFCSKNTELQKWCETVKNKRVKANALKFVVGGARDYMKGKTQLRDTSASVTANWKDNPVGTLQNVLQAKGIMPEYSEPDEFMGRIAVTLYVSGYDDVVMVAQNQKEARKACAIEFAQKYLGIDVAKEAQKVADAPKPKQAQQTQQQPQTTKLPQTFAVSPDKCGDWDRDAVSALQIFCQKNKIAVPQYFNKGTSQGYVTQTTMTLKWGDVEVTKSAGTKQDAKQECARAFRKEILEAPKSKEQQKTPASQNQERGEPDPTKFGGWKEHPWLTLQDYCDHYHINLDIDTDTVSGPLLTVGKETFEVYDPYHNEMSDSEIKDDLAKFFYKKKVEPILKKQQKQARDNTSADALRDFPVPNMGEYQEKDNFAWAGALNQLCAKAHLPLPELVEAAIVKNGKETRCHFPNKFNLKGWRDDETRVMYMKMAGIAGKIRGEGKQFKDAQHDAAKNCLHLIWYDHKITEAKEEGNDKMVEFYISQKQKLEKKCLVGTQMHKPQPQKQPEVKDFDQGLELLKARFNGGRGGKK